jgi:hypothetical protein
MKGIHVCWGPHAKGQGAEETTPTHPPTTPCILKGQVQLAFRRHINTRHCVEREFFFFFFSFLGSCGGVFLLPILWIDGYEKFFEGCIENLSDD